MSDRTRNRINAAFDEELSVAPVPPSLRALSMRAAIAAPRPRSRRPEFLALVAAVLVIALVATVFVATHHARNAPAPAGSTIPPEPIANAASAFDLAHGELVIFGGGNGPHPPANETWTWDGKYWRHLHPTVSPPATNGSVMTFDASRGNVVLYRGDTWTWNGTTWRLMHPQHQPSVESPAMAFDPVSKRVILIGPTQPSSIHPDAQTEVWSWNGSDWTQLPPLTSVPWVAAMVSDGNHLLVLATTTGGRYVTQTVEWSGAADMGWAVLKPQADLPLIGAAAGAYDPGRQQLVLLTGDTWTWDGSKWSRQHPTLQPQGIGYMAYVPSLHEVVSWGDRTASVDNEMFGWDGSDWKLLEPGTAVWPVNNGKGRFASRLTPEQAAPLVRSTVQNTHPVLLPASLPSGGPWDALVQATADDFNITYESDQRDKTITLCICAANPPPATGPNAKEARVRFRNAAPLKFGTSGFADYLVYDTTDPYSQRWLMWLEPGSATNSMDYNGGVYYFLSTTGLTDAEFWQVANSLQ